MHILGHITQNVPSDLKNINKFILIIEDIILDLSLQYNRNIQ